MFDLRSGVLTVRSFRIAAATLAVPVVLLASACGESSPSDLTRTGAGDAVDTKGPSNEALTSAELVTKAEDSLKGVTDLHIEGTGKAFDLPIGVDLKLGAGEQGEGRISLKDKNIDIVAVDKTLYVRLAPGTLDLLIETGKRAEAATPSTEEPGDDGALDEEFTKMFAAAGKLIEGKYIKLGDSEMGELGGDLLSGGSTSLDGLFGGSDDSGSEDTEGTEDPEEAEPEVTKGPITEINGVKTIPLITKDPEANETMTIYVAANGVPYPIRLTGDTGSDGTNELELDLKYSKLSGGVTPKAPPAAEVIDLNALMESFGSSLFGDEGDDTDSTDSPGSTAGA